MLKSECASSHPVSRVNRSGVSEPCRVWRAHRADNYSIRACGVSNASFPWYDKPDFGRFYRFGRNFVACFSEKDRNLAIVSGEGQTDRYSESVEMVDFFVVNRVNFCRLRRMDISQTRTRVRFLILNSSLSSSDWNQYSRLEFRLNSNSIKLDPKLEFDSLRAFPYTGWPISKETLKKFEYLHRNCSKWAHFFTKDRGMFILQIHTNTVSESLCLVSLLISIRNFSYFTDREEKHCTGWRKRQFAEKKIEYLYYGLNKEVNFPPKIEVYLHSISIKTRLVRSCVKYIVSFSSIYEIGNFSYWDQ